MKREFLVSILLSITFISLFAQQNGDTLIVKAFKYGSSSRDTLISFPSGNLSYEKIIMKYNMRCKNALISTQAAPDQGCGEWDYSCNTFIVDSTTIESATYSHPSHTINNFSGSTFLYTTTPLFDYYSYALKSVVLDSLISETTKVIGSGSTPIPQLLKADEKSGKSLLLYTVSELVAAGFTAGAINGIALDVANTGGTTNFLKVGIMQSGDSLLNADSVVTTGFTNVFNNHFSFIPGSNRIQFYTPFVWDGISNLLIELSFTNTIPSTPIVLNGHTTSVSRSLYATNNYALDLSSNGLVNINTSHLSSLSNEITLSFWSYGHPDLLPANTSIIYGYANNLAQRHLNVHLPWASGIIYFDCGFSGSYDRINKTALVSEYEGQWNHWAFTKNTSTGVMNMYLNGVLWQSGTGKTKPMSILNLRLGNNDLLNANYKGKIKELSIWNKELPLTEIELFKNKGINAGHPSYSNLLAYYKTNEGSGASITDTKNNVISNGSNINWSFDRGDKIETFFIETTLRPNLTLLRGNYLLDTATVFVMDSVLRPANTVNYYSITPAPAGALMDDIVVLDSTHSYFQTTPIKITDGDNDTLIGTIAVAPTDSIVISTLSYFRRFPFYNEIMSFVTPYGKGLDLGLNGRTWYFDVTDFLPLLKGNKRLMMSGGIWQEELDIDFYFIVGTPARNIVDFKQLWQGNARGGNASIAAINNNTRFAPVTIPLPSNAQQFKVRAVITGHGSEGEFHNNGGNINHYLSVNSTSNDYSWQITEECSMNPIFPQGGTWVYDRQGWCPGQYSLLKEFNITPLVIPGSNAIIDYNCSPPLVSTGDYRYIAAIQLVSYGAANHTLDANLIDILAPSENVVYSRKNPICDNPRIMIQNTGSTSITAVEIEYWLNNASVKQTYTWTGTLAFMDTAFISLPIGSLWLHDLLPANNRFFARLLRVNTVTDDYSHNNQKSSAFSVTEKIPSKFILEVKTNNYPQHNSYRIVDENGTVVPGTSILSAANTIYRDTLELYGCYTLIVDDTQGDGLQWWANTAQGAGYVRIKTVTGSMLKNFQADFGGGFQFSFTTQGGVNIEETDQNTDLILYPNPATDQITLQLNGIEKCEISIQDLLGRSFEPNILKSGNTAEINTSQLPPGIYFIRVGTTKGVVVRKVVIE